MYMLSSGVGVPIAGPVTCQADRASHANTSFRFVILSPELIVTEDHISTAHIPTKGTLLVIRLHLYISLGVFGEGALDLEKVDVPCMAPQILSMPMMMTGSLGGAMVGNSVVPLALLAGSIELFRSKVPRPADVLRVYLSLSPMP